MTPQEEKERLERLLAEARAQMAKMIIERAAIQAMDCDGSDSDSDSDSDSSSDWVEEDWEDEEAEVEGWSYCYDWVCEDCGKGWGGGQSKNEVKESDGECPHCKA